MTENKWSEEQPPEWTGPPLGSTPPQQPWAPPTEPPIAPQPEAQAASSAPTTAGFGDMLLQVWRGVVSRLGVYLGVSVLSFVVVFAAAIASLKSLLPNGLSNAANSLLQGDTTVLDEIFANREYATDAEMAVFLEILREVGIVFGVLVAMTLVLQIVTGSVLTRYALADLAGARITLGEAVRTTPFGKVITNLLAIGALFIAVFFGFAVLCFFSLSVPAIGLLIFWALFFTFIIGAVWFGIGITFISAVVVGEGIGGFAAIKQALTLAKGRRLVIFGLAVLVSIASTVPANVFGTAITTFAEPGFTTFTLGNGFPYILSVPVTAVLSAVLYRNFKK